MQGNRTAGLHLRRIAQWAIAGTISLIAITAVSATPPLVITSPVEGTIATAGKPIVITVSVTSGNYPAGLAIVGQDPLGTTSIQPASGSMKFSLTVPADTPPDSYAIRVVGMNAKGELVSSAPINVRVEGADAPISLAIHPSAISFSNVGDTRDLTVVGQFAGGSFQDLTHSSRLVIRSEDLGVAVVRDGIIVAVGPGRTSVSFQYESVSSTTTVTVAAGAAVPKK